MKASRSEGAAVLAAAAMICAPCFAETFSTFCTPGQSVLNTNTLAFANGLSVGGNGQYTAVGIQNGYHVDTFLWIGMPDKLFTGATLVCPVALRGTMKGAAMDIWWIGTMSSVSSPGNSYSISWHTYDDTTPARPMANGSYYLLNGRMPVKVVNDAIPINTYVDWGKAGQYYGTKDFSSEALNTQIGMAFNRGATTNDYMLLRLNPDALQAGGEFRFSGYNTTKVESGDAISAVHIDFDTVAGVTAPAPRLSAAERASEWYVRSNVEWVQYRDSDGAAGFSYPAYCGVKDGKTRDLMFTFNAPEYTVTNAWLSLNALPPFTGTIPAGARVKLSLLGFVDAPAANTDLLVSDAMLEGQEEVVLQDNVLLYGIASGTSLLSEGLGQRNLIRALNARAKAAALANSGISGKKAVLRLSVTSPNLSSDWGFSIGSVATPGVEAFFECIEYRKWITLFTNTDFEDGMTGWKVSNKTYTESQMSVIDDPTDPSNHCLRFWNTDTPTADLEVVQSKAYPASFLKSIDGMPYRYSYRIYLPSSNPITRKGSSLTEYGWHIIGGYPSGSFSQINWGRSCDESSTKDSWLWTRSAVRILPTNLTGDLRIYLQFRCSNAIDVNDNAMYYVDDYNVEVQQFYDYPDEPKGMMLIFR